MKFRLLVAILVVLATVGRARAQAKYLPESNNAALRYWAALVEMRDNPLTVKPTQKMLLAVMKGETAWNEEKMGPVLDVYADSIQTMQRGAKLPDCNWGLDYQLGNLNLGQTLMRSRGLEELNTVEGVRQLAKGDSKAAVETWRAGIRFSQDLGRSGPLINAMVASALLMDELHAVANYAGPGKLPEAQREELYAAVKAMPEDGFDWGLAWGVEYAIAEQFLQQLRTSSNPKAVYEKYGYDAPKGLPPTTGRFESTRNTCLRRWRPCVRQPPRQELVPMIWNQRRVAWARRSNFWLPLFVSPMTRESGLQRSVRNCCGHWLRSSALHSG